MNRILFILLLSLPTLTFGQNMGVRWHNEAADTTRVTELLKEAASVTFANPSQATAWFGRKFIGTPYVAHTLEGEEEYLTVNLDELDCTTFVETALALAATRIEQRQSWHDYVYNLRKLRYRAGEVDGYASRLHYICDWASDNTHRGNLRDITRDIPECRWINRTIDFMSSNRSRYPSLADSAQFEKIKNIEAAFHNHRFPYIRTTDLGKKSVQRYLREGDILAFVSTLKNLDVTHMGMVVSDESGNLRVLHASSTNGVVEISSTPLADFVKRNPKWMGVRIFRLES